MKKLFTQKNPSDVSEGFKIKLIKIYFLAAA